jgi:uncharacterized protein
MTVNEPTNPERQEPGFSDTESAAPNAGIVPSDPPFYTWPATQEPLVAMQPPVSAPPPRLLPNIGHTLVLFLLVIATAFTGYITAFLSFMTVEHISLRALQDKLLHSTSWAIGLQAIWYVELWAVAMLVFSLWWGRSMFKGISWNSVNAGRWFFRLAAIGIATSAVVTLAPRFLHIPIPPTTPILKDLQMSRTGAWVMAAFGITLAPFTEELAFRGFLLPSLINIFRWMQRRRMIGEGTVRGFGIPLSIALTSVGFAFVHGAQLSYAWGPMLLIGLVSVVLCIVRLRTSSVAAGVVVHVSYNFLLFALLASQTDWFRHLDKLKG